MAFISMPRTPFAHPATAADRGQPSSTSQKLLIGLLRGGLVAGHGVSASQSQQALAVVLQPGCQRIAFVRGCALEGFDGTRSVVQIEIGQSFQIGFIGDKIEGFRSLQFMQRIRRLVRCQRQGGAALRNQTCWMMVSSGYSLPSFASSGRASPRSLQRARGIGRLEQCRL